MKGHITRCHFSGKSRFYLEGAGLLLWKVNWNTGIPQLSIAFTFLIDINYYINVKSDKRDFELFHIGETYFCQTRVSSLVIEIRICLRNGFTTTDFTTCL